MTTLRLDDLGTSTTLESNKSLASLARAVWVRQRRSHNAYTWSMTARSACNWGHPRLTRHKVLRSVVFRCRWTNRYRWVNNAAPCAASRFLVRAATFAADVLGRPLGNVGYMAARPFRALATAPTTALTISLMGSYPLLVTS